MGRLDADGRPFNDLRIIAKTLREFRQKPVSYQQKNHKHASDDHKIGNGEGEFHLFEVSVVPVSRDHLPIAFEPCCDHSCHNMHPTAPLKLESERQDLNPAAQTARCSKAPL